MNLVYTCKAQTVKNCDETFLIKKTENRCSCLSTCSSSFVEDFCLQKIKEKEEGERNAKQDDL